MRGTSHNFNVGAFGEVLFSLVLVSSTPAQVITLIPENTRAPETVPDSSGMFSWVEWESPGLNGLGQQWFWYRVGEGVPPSKVFDLNLLQTHVDSAEGLHGTAPNSPDRELDELLAKAPAGLASAELKDPKTGKPLPFHFFQYSDFDLPQSAPGSFLTKITEPPALTHSSHNSNSQATSSDTLPSVPIEESKAPAALDSLAEQGPLDLSISAGPDNSLILKLSRPGRLQSTTSLNGDETIWHDEGIVSNILSITPSSSHPALFFRLLPP